MDISNFMSWFLEQFGSLFSFVLNLLGRITFLGTSLLQYIVTLMILGVVLNILIAGVRNRAVREVSRDDRKNKNKDDSKE